MTKDLNDRLQRYYRQFGRDHDRQRVAFLDELVRIAPPQPSASGRHWSTAKRAACSLLVIAVVGAFVLVLIARTNPPRSELAAEWWRGSALAWAEQADAALRQTAENYVTWREKTLRVANDGTRRVTGNHTRVYSSKQAYRRDSYYLNKRVGIQWYTQEGGDVVLTGLRLETKTYSVSRDPGHLDWTTSDRKDPRAWIREIPRDSRSEELGRKEIEGHESIGFKLTWADASGKSQTSFYWFDIETRLPIKAETVLFTVSGGPRILVLDHFHFDADLPPEIFEPGIPEGYVEAESG